MNVLLPTLQLHRGHRLLSLLVAEGLPSDHVCLFRRCEPFFPSPTIINGFHLLARLTPVQ